MTFEAPTANGWRTYAPDPRFAVRPLINDRWAPTYMGANITTPKGVPMLTIDDAAKVCAHLSAQRGDR